MADSSRRLARVAPAVAAIAGCAFAVGCSDGGSLDLNDLKSSNAPFYFVGESFDGLEITHVERYQRGVATFTYGSCEARDDEGCAPPLELQHRLCHGTVTVVIFANEMRASRAPDALRPLSRGASPERPEIVLNRSPQCMPDQ